jgi:hypothetical protein
MKNYDMMTDRELADEIAHMGFEDADANEKEERE